MSKLLGNFIIWDTVATLKVFGESGQLSKSLSPDQLTFLTGKTLWLLSLHVLNEERHHHKKVKMCLKAGIFWQWGSFPTAGTFMLIMGIIPTAPSCLFLAIYIYF